MATDQELWQYATLRRGVNSQQDILENIPSPYRCRICGSAEVKTRFLALFFLGLPIAWSEWAMGRFGGQQGYNSCPGIFRSIWKNRLAPYLGVLGLIVPVVIYMYYLWIESWCLGYAWKYLTGQMNLGMAPPPSAASTNPSPFPTARKFPALSAQLFPLAALPMHD